jgi:hypothetical protein
VAAQRGAEPARLAKLLREELDWIVMRALEKDRERRYQSASEFAKEVRRYLADEPVEACPPSRRYRLGKFYRKHRTPPVATCAFVILLVLGVVWLTVAYARENQLRQQAVTAEKVMREGYRLADATLAASIANGTKLKQTQQIALRRALGRLPLHEAGLTEQTQAARPSGGSWSRTPASSSRTIARRKPTTAPRFNSMRSWRATTICRGVQARVGPEHHPPGHRPERAGEAVRGQGGLRAGHRVTKPAARRLPE